jgi:formate hydrogenlyase subunit 4
MTALEIVAHVVVVLVLPPLLLGVIARTKAMFGGRKGPPLLQPYWDLIKLARRGSVLSATTTWVFRAGPVVGVATGLIAGALVPVGADRALIAFPGDFILLAYALGLARFFTMTAALDTGSAFEGMGAAREATFGCLAEPALFLVLFALVHATGELSLSKLLGSELQPAWAGQGASLVLVAAGLFIVVLAENSRIPVDDPNTHLELTMIHEVMVLDHSGPAFGLVLYGAALKLYVFVAILVHLVLPATEPVFRWITFLAGVLGIAVLIGIVESTMARLKMTHVPALLVAASLSCTLGVVLLLQ